MEFINYCNGTNNCMELEFWDLQGGDVYVAEDNYVDLKFYVTTGRCQKAPQTILVKITTPQNQEHTDVCLVHIDSGTCLVSDASTACYCAARNGPVHFFFKVSERDSSRVFRWLWGDQSSQMKHRVVKVHVGNPPLSAPVIEATAEGRIFHIGQNVTLTCTVSGGKPVVSSVNFTCTKHDDAMDFVNNSSVSSSVIFAPVTAEDDGCVCFCSAMWQPNTQMYLKNSSFVVILSDSRALHPVVIIVSACSASVFGFAIVMVCFVVWYKNGRRKYEQPLPRQEQETHMYNRLELRAGEVLMSKEEENSYEEIPDSARVSAGAGASNDSGKGQTSDHESTAGNHTGHPAENLIISVSPDRQDYYLHPMNSRTWTLEKKTHRQNSSDLLKDEEHCVASCSTKGQGSVKHIVSIVGSSPQGALDSSAERSSE